MPPHWLHKPRFWSTSTLFVLALMALCALFRPATSAGGDRAPASTERAGAPQAVQLSVSPLQDSTVTVSPGGVLTMTTQIRNTGGTTFTDVAATANADPRHLEYREYSPLPSTVATAPTDAFISWADLTVGSPYGYGAGLGPGQVFTLTVSATAHQLGEVQHCVDITATSSAGRTTGTICTEVIIREQSSAMQVSHVLLEPAGGPAVAGGLVAYSIELTNVGSEPITFLRLHNTYDPSHLSFDDTTYTPDDPADDGSLDWSDLTQPAPRGIEAPLVPEESVFLRLYYWASQATPLGSSTQNCIGVRYRKEEGPEYIVADRCIPLTIVPEEGISVGVDKMLLAPKGRPAMPGEAVLFALRLVNSGTTVLETVSLTDTYPVDCLKFVPSHSGNPGDTADNGVLRWSNLLRLVPGMAALPPGGWVQLMAGLRFSAKPGDGCNPTLNRMDAVAVDTEDDRALAADEELVHIDVEGMTATPTPTRPDQTTTPTTEPTATATATAASTATSTAQSTVTATAVSTATSTTPTPATATATVLAKITATTTPIGTASATPSLTPTPSATSTVDMGTPTPSGTPGKPLPRLYLPLVLKNVGSALSRVSGDWELAVTTRDLQAGGEG